jgi:hypothetical protein
MCRFIKWVCKMAEPSRLTPPPDYSTSVPAALGIPAGRAEELNRWLFETVILSCPLRTDVLDMINAGRGIENLTQIEKLFLAFVFGRVSMIRPPGMGVLVGGRVP